MTTARRRTLEWIPSLIALAALVLPLSACANRTRTAAEPPKVVTTEDSEASDSSKAESGYDPRLSVMTATREPWTFAEHQGYLITTPNYRLYTTVESPEFLETLPLFCEAALDHYTSALGPLPQPPVKLETFLFRTRSQWQLKTQEMLPEQSKMFSNLGRGGYTTKGTSVLYYIDRWGYPRDTLAIAAHEGWHQYTQQTFKHQLPIWLEEGVATYMEGYRIEPDDSTRPIFDPMRNYERLSTLRDAVKSDRLIPLESLMTRSPQSFLNESKDLLLVYYSQVWALTRFLAEGESGRYNAGLMAILNDAAEGRLVGRMMSSHETTSMRKRGAGLSSRVGPAVAREYFNRDLDELDMQFRTFCAKVIELEYRRRGRR